MNRSILWGLLLGVSVTPLVASCAWDAPNPAAYKPQPGYPCGVMGVPCLDPQGNLDGNCCGQGDTCGGGKYEVGCGTYAEHLCCFIEPTQTTEAAKRDADGGATLPEKKLTVRGKQFRP